MSKSIIHTDFCHMYGIKYPIVLAGMGYASGPALTAAVSNAGGLGVLGAASMTTDELPEMIRRTRALTDKPFGANLFMMNPRSDQFARLLAEEGVRAVTLSGGSPKVLIPLLHELGIKALVVVPTAKVAASAESHGADAIVAEGSESGGIQGYQGASTIVLTPAVVDAVKVPVIAAGGIGDSRGYKATLALGAEGVQVGTRFIASVECIAHATYKDIILQSPETGTELLDRGRLRIRALHTPLVEKLLQNEQMGDYVFGAKAMEASWLKGDADAGVLPAGQISGLIHSILSVKEIIGEMVS